MNKAEKRERNARIVEMYDKGFKTKAIAGKEKISIQYIYKIIKDRGDHNYKVELPKDKQKRLKRESKISQMAEYYTRGWTLERIGQKYGITRERVRQLLKETVLTKKDGGQAIRMEKAKPARDKAIQRHKEKALLKARNRVKKHFGCSLELWEKLGGKKWQTQGYRNRRGHPIQNFTGVRNQTRVRGVKWTLTLKEWWDLWKVSGKWAERGAKTDQYVLARIDKAKPYKMGNVRIVKAQDSK